MSQSLSVEKSRLTPKGLAQAGALKQLEVGRKAEEGGPLVGNGKENRPERWGSP